MKKYLSIAVTILFVTLVFITSCQKDVFVPPLPTLEGTYDGTYMVITGYNTPSADTSFSTLEMRFSDESYWFDSENSPDNFCSPRGGYVLTGTIEITERNDGCNVTAKERDNPRGVFSIRRPGDSVIMLQQLPPDTLKQILLLRR